MAIPRLGKRIGNPSLYEIIGNLLIFLAQANSQTAAFPTQVLHEEFEYDPYSPFGPPFWGEIDAGDHQYLQWREENGEILHNLDVDENECASSTKQSPVNLLPNEVCTDTHEILSRQIRKSDCKFDDFSWSITPHLLRATMPLNNDFCIRPHIDLPNGFGNKWPLQYMELHMRSEHTLDGRRFDAELQMIHLGTEPNEEKLAIVSMMMEATSPEDDEMVQWMIDEWQSVADKRDEMCNGEVEVPTIVLEGRGLREKFLKQREKASNEYVPPRVHRHLNPSNHAAHKGEEKNVNHEAEFLPWDHPSLVYGDSYREGNVTGEIYPIVENDIEQLDKHIIDGRALQTNQTNQTQRVKKGPRKKMFPYIMWPTIYYYRYRGSLTVPPCSKIVHWRVLDEPRAISIKQLRQMAKILQTYRDAETCKPDTHTHPVTGENWRPTHLQTDKETTHCQRENFSYWRYWPEKQ